MALANLLWSESDDSAASNSLRVTLYNLRQVFKTLLPVVDDDETGLIVTRQTVQLILPPPFPNGTPFGNGALSSWWVDIMTFDAGIAQQQEYDRQSAVLGENRVTQLMESIALYTGDFLANFHVADAPDFDAWRIQQQEMRHRQVCEILHTLIAHYNAQGEYAQTIEVARRLLELEPWLEAGHQHLIRALALTGQRSLALQQYEACRQVLRAELHIPPGTETVALQRQIREGALGWEGPSDSALPNPYRGLQAFDTADAENFFGRTALIQRLVARMHHAISEWHAEDAPSPPQANEEVWMRRFLAVVGPSGSGKSSVVRAGLLRLIRERRQHEKLERRARGVAACAAPYRADAGQAVVLCHYATWQQTIGRAHVSADPSISHMDG